MRPLALALTIAALSTSGCKTRLYDLEEVGESGLDLATRDGPPVPPARDLARFPDLTPPPDLVLPFVCREIYVVDQSTHMLSGFDTGLARFFDVGVLRCPGVGAATPETMSIARDGTAWVFYNGGQLFKADVRTAACFATAFDGTKIGGQAFGSSFSADVPGGPSETLFVALSNDMLLETVDTRTLALTKLASLQGPAELTGTSAADLWGYFPSQSSFIARIDKRTGAFDNRIALPQIQAGGGFAFSFWGGSFWVFNGEGAGGETTVYRVDRQSGAVTTVLRNTRRHIVGAGVSSCAPLGLDQ